MKLVELKIFNPDDKTPKDEKGILLYDSKGIPRKVTLAEAREWSLGKRQPVSNDPFVLGGNGD